MGNQKVKWTWEEEEALKAGVAKHGTGKWKNILQDPQFGPSLANRSNIDLKDKWRNLGFSTSAQPRAKATAPDALINHQNSPSLVSVAEDDTMDDPCKSPQDGKAASRFNALIFEAISATKFPNGADIGAIFGYIKPRHEVPQNFRKQLSTKLRRLVLQGRLEKVENCYRIKDTELATMTPTLTEKDIRPAQNTRLIITGETLEDAAMAAAHKIAESEYKSLEAAEAIEEAERISKMAEDTESVLQLVNEIYEQCSRGEIILLG